MGSVQPFVNLDMMVSVSIVPAQVTCGSLIKLLHIGTNHRLHSHEIAYGSGSGQQSVTGFSGADDANSYWIVRGTEVGQKARCILDFGTWNASLQNLQSLLF